MRSNSVALNRRWSVSARSNLFDDSLHIIPLLATYVLNSNSVEPAAAGVLKGLASEHRGLKMGYTNSGIGPSACDHSFATV
jgi:hypothetical protein